MQNNDFRRAFENIEDIDFANYNGNTIDEMFIDGTGKCYVMTSSNVGAEANFGNTFDLLKRVVGYWQDAALAARLKNPN
ncbi:hypothetical protein IV38_GL001031 [Lactobacillus selangorensis]|uniref:Uncharacterized protein n=1 Tax=Lactobacillus selangorensis TaxID=81857 RepID=A0A0R2FJP8_9LACO|nr:hypothetical protein [Lactobacillus selangorensis]KRN28824.1 hypothetical protein IV38_GL001031 [Lactobacillus selangorensis]KRN32766.1 hypothetical protein IV40_GL000822 [Lactobacillus selangorensis]